MTPRTLIGRSLRFHWRSHLGVVLGAAIGSAALIGALIVGDSVRHSLREKALERLGNISVAWTAGDRLVRQELATSAQKVLGNDWRVEPVLAVAGSAAREDGTARANQVQVIGAGADFFSLGGASNQIKEGEVLLNESLASQLQAKAGELIVLRVRKPSALSIDAAIASQSENAVALRLRVAGILSGKQLGNFSLRANQVPPMNAFIDITALAASLDVSGRANLLLAGATRPAAALPPAPALPVTLADLQLQLSGTNTIDLRTSRVFLDAPLTEAALGASNPPAQPILTYVVNLLSAGTNSTPYSMVTAVGAPYTPADLRDDEIIVNEWLAEDLQVKAGDTIALTFFNPDSSTQLVEQTNRFRVRASVPLSGVYADRTLMPDFPGIAKAESTHDWDAGFPLVHKIRPKDDQYWKQHRGTPKAFITFAAGQKMWANRFGNATAVRWPVPDGVTSDTISSNVARHMLSQITPEEVGISFQAVREDALRAAAQSQDFGGLFIGFSFFLIAAALILMGLLFRFGVEQRAAEIGTLLAVGYTPRQVRRIFLMEGAALAILGGIVGTVGGIVYAQAMLRGLTTIWKTATNTSALSFHISPPTLAAGLLSGVLVALITVWLVLRKQARQPPRALLGGDLDAGVATRGKKRSLRAPGAPIVALLSLLLAVLAAAAAVATGQTANPLYFFGAGSLCLIAGLAFTAWMLSRMISGPAQQRVSSSSLALRGSARRKTRSVATVALLSCGVFLIAAIGVFRLDADQNAWKRTSGTGGFALIAESTLPIVKDLNTPDGRDALGLDEKVMQGVSFVPFRVREGDDASCLNLNRAQQPRLLGVDPAALAQRGAFTFAKVEGGRRDASPWNVLENAGEGAIPAIGDAASIQWALRKKIGDSLPYEDERGREFNVRLAGGLANSILQGALVIDEAELKRRFPSVTGYRMFLVDCPSNAVKEVGAELSRALQDYGFEVAPAAERLAAFNAVQNTYLSTFQVLGGLGLLLGSAGLGVVVLRNVLERRGELALLIAIGFRRSRVQRLVLMEHAALLCVGLGIGILSALVAVSPALVSPRGEVPVASLALTFGGVVLFGFVSTWMATRAAVRGDLLQGLRNE